MSRPKVVVYRNLVRNVSQIPEVRRALKARAEQIAARAEQIAAAEQYEVHAHVEEGTHRDGRAYAQVRSDDADQEFGTWGKKRRRILGRAAELGE